MKTNVCGESNGLKLSGLLSVLYTDGGEQTNLEGCSAKVAVIDGLGSQGPLEVLVVADAKDFTKPSFKFDLAQDSVRLLVLPPRDVDECLGEGDVTNYQRAVDSFATNVWHGLVAPKNPLDALNEHVADQIFQDIVPRTMAPAQAVGIVGGSFVKEWRSVTQEDYDLLWKEHFNPRDTDSTTEYDDLTALNNIVVRAVAPPEKSSRSWSSVVGQRAMEYGGVLVAVLTVERLLAALGYLDGIWPVSSGSSGLSGSSVSSVSSGNDSAVAQGLHQVMSSKWSCQTLPSPDMSFFYRDYMFVDPATGWDLNARRLPLEKCREMAAKTEPGDYLLTNQDLSILPREYYLYCGHNNKATLMCAGLGAATPQCFDFISGMPGPHNFEFLWSMLGRVFHPTGHEACVVRCYPEHDDSPPDGSKAGVPAFREKLKKIALNRLIEADRVRDIRIHNNVREVGDACTQEGLQTFQQAVRKRYPPGSLSGFQKELSRMWFKVPCGGGVWTQNEPFPECTCPKFSITCTMSNDLRQMYEVTVDAYNTASQDAFRDFIGNGKAAFKVMQNMEPKRCLYDCFTQISPD
ncbi:hypothetical protein GNI_162690 [Gregarina niphandrodes]|uniref:Uncharacterized protein n=1 Tax=Gregarina niphandrodes TaxID=110365 RepID=A0A023AYG0_GRENI|nr:hypothetical protein GNI_162690 [Gregarina niphandrodes]EZG43684.1 hypothetical protein GNI_162690 [Gregarina niphandrodes]|eukprot:XP_011133091.1 hypothetical protein GNI_162690 [Gregarina niphandrodes]